MSGFELDIGGEGEISDQRVDLVFGEKLSVSKMEVIFAYAVVTTCGFFVVAMLSHTKFGYLLSVLTPIHNKIIMSRVQKCGEAGFDWCSVGITIRY